MCTNTYKYTFILIVCCCMWEVMNGPCLSGGEVLARKGQVRLPGLEILAET